MNRVRTSRTAFRALALGLGPAACIGGHIATRPAIRCDAPALGEARLNQPRWKSSFDPSPDTVRQISSGSVAGFASGFVVALFSRTLALLAGLVAVSLHVASRYGYDVSRFLDKYKALGLGPAWKKSQKDPLFTISFLVTFISAAFVHI